jgi:hypothetical protein
MKRKGWNVLAVCCLLAGPAAMAAQDHADGFAHEPREAAMSWLALVDAEEYQASWQATATAFQAAEPAQSWSARLTAGRAQIGAVEKRELVYSQAMTDPPGAPAGEYVQLGFRSTFSGAGDLVESVVLVLDGDRGWRVAGYFIQPAG